VLEPSSVIRKMQMKVRIRCYYTLSRKAKTKMTDDTKCGQRRSAMGTQYTAGGSINWHSLFRKLVTSTTLIPLLGRHPVEMSVMGPKLIHKNVATLFIIVPNGDKSHIH
jgi:hypothetical protein